MQPSSNAENNPKHNRPQKHNIYSQVKHYRSSLISYIVEKYDNSSFKKTTMPFNLNRSISTSVSMAIFIYNQKSFVRRRLRRCRLRHKIHAIKTRPNNPLRFLQHKNIILHYLANDLTCAARKTTFRTGKRFHNKQYTPKPKDQPFESKRTHFYVRFNNGSIAMHRQTIIFLLSHKIATFQQKTKHNKHEKPSHQSIAKSITKNHNKQPTQPLNQNHPKNKPSKQTQQPIMTYTKIFEY